MLVVKKNKLILWKDQLTDARNGSDYIVNWSARYSELHQEQATEKWGFAGDISTVGWAQHERL